MRPFPECPDGLILSGGWASWQSLSPMWETWSRDMIPCLEGIDVRWIELGSFEGRSAIMTLLAFPHPESFITCIDNWTPKSSVNFETEKRFDHNIKVSGMEDRVEKCKGHWADILSGLKGTFDGAYIDADHLAQSVLQQSCRLWPHIREGGFMVWDDYRRGPENNELPVGPGVDAFLGVFKGSYVVLHKGWQIIIQKTVP